MAKAPRPGLRWFDKLLLFVAWLVTCGVVYVLGYKVGKETPSRHAAIEQRTVRLPVTSTPPAEGRRPKENKEFPSFYQALPAGERPIDVARGTPVTAPGAVAATTTLARTTTTAARATTLPTPTTTMPRPAPTTTLPRPAATTTLPRSAVTTSTLAARPAVTPTTLARAAAPPPATAPTPVVPRATSRGGYTVEASPTRSRSEAEQLLATLRRRGYDASIVQVERDGDTWYRLRVGRYASSEQATDTMRKLRDVEGVTHVFVATD